MRRGFSSRIPNMRDTIPRTGSVATEICSQSSFTSPGWYREF
jgi:hypothetical protein